MCWKRWWGSGRNAVPCELGDRQRDSVTLPRVCPEGPQLREQGCAGHLPLPKGFTHVRRRSVCAARQTKPPKARLAGTWGPQRRLCNSRSCFYRVERRAGAGRLAYGAVKTRENRTNALIKICSLPSAFHKTHSGDISQAFSALSTAGKAAVPEKQLVFGVTQK